MAFIKDNPAPATIILISGDRDFAYLLSTIRWRKYNVILICNSFMTHESLTSQASFVHDWQSDILKTRPTSKIHPVGLPNEHTTPTIRPLALSPPLVGIATTGTTRSIHAALPPDAPFVESDATPIRSKTEIPAEAISAGIPMIPASDDRITAYLTSKSAMVHLVIIHRVVTDLGFQQDLSSPRTIDPVDEDSVYSPAFVSTCTEVALTQPLTPEFPEFSGDNSTRGQRRRFHSSRIPGSHQ